MLFGQTILALCGSIALVAAAPVQPSNQVASVVEIDKRSPPKRGIAFNSANVVNQFKSGKVSWAYNWATNPAGAVSGVEYVPQLWGPKMYSYWKRDANAALRDGCGHLLGFNEPDIESQAFMPPQAAAADYRKHLTPFGKRASLGSPACSSSEEPGKGLQWMREFFAACKGCGIEFMATHWYGTFDQADFFKRHVNDAIALAKENGIGKIWITEFAGTGDEAQEKAFMAQVLPWLDAKPEVARYAYYYAAPGHMMNGNAVNALGNQYIHG